MLAGRLSPQSGAATRAPKLVVGYFAQHQLDELDGSLSPLETLAELRPTLSDAVLRTQLGGFGLSGEKALTSVAQLSGGERARLMLAIATLDSPNLLILDEPTNHLDIDAREELLLALNNFPGAVVLVSHDRRLIEATVDQLILVAGGAATRYDGDLDDYETEILSSAPPSGEKRTSISNRDLRRERAEQRIRLKPLKDQAAAIENEIAQLTREIAEIDSALARGNLFGERGRRCRHGPAPRGGLARTYRGRTALARRLAGLRGCAQRKLIRLRFLLRPAARRAAGFAVKASSKSVRQVRS